MLGSEAETLGWLLRTVVGGGLLFLLAWVVMVRTRAPARRERLGEWAIAAGLLLAILALGPAWLLIHLPAPDTAVPRAATTTAPEGVPPRDADLMPPVQALNPLVWQPGLDMEPPAAPAPEPAPREADPQPQPPSEPALAAAPVAPVGIRERLPEILRAGYVLGAGLLLSRWLLGHLALWRLLRQAKSAPAAAQQMWQEMNAGRPKARLLVSGRVRVPFSCGLLRQAIVLPVALAEGVDSSVLRWVLAHEQTHLQRRDAWASLLFGLGQPLYFYLPWFWWVRRQVRLCQEYIADAAAAAVGRPEDYAQFLVEWSTAPAAPVGATGVFGSSSDLFRRITMLLKSPVPVEPRCPRRWSLGVACGLLSVAVLAAGIGLRAVAAPVAGTNEDPKKEDVKKDKSKDEAAKRPTQAAPEKDAPRIDPFQFNPFPNGVPGLDAEGAKQIQEQMRRAHEEMRRAQVDFQKALQLGQQPFMYGDFRGFKNLHRPGRDQQVRLGVEVEKPSPTLVEQLDLPKDQGLVIEEVVANTAAAKAGLKPHDILLELNGKPVPSKIDEFVKELQEIKAKTPIDVVVLRKGKKETIKGLSLPEARPVRPEAFPDVQFQLPNFQPQGFQIPNIQVAPGAFAGALQGNFGGNSVMTTTVRTNDRFTTRHQEGSLVITVTGKVKDGKAAMTEIRVQDGAESHTYTSIEKVPEQYRDKVKNLVDMTEKGPEIRIRP
jgi:beta-lactamase regulating signal transducer with metallopeptidase domain